MAQQPQEPAEAIDSASGALARPVRVLAFVGAVLSVVFYLLGFVGDVGTTGLVGALVLGGGLLAGTAALPRTGRVLAPAAVVVTVGTLGLLQTVVTSRGGSVLLLGALVIAFLQAVVVVGALLMDARNPGAAARRSQQQPVGQARYPAWSTDPAWTPQYQGQAPGAGPSDLTPADMRPSDTTMSSGGHPGGALLIPAAPSDTTAMLPDGALGVGPAFGMSGGVERATEVVPAYGLAAAGPPGGADSPSVAGEAQAPVYGLSGDAGNTGATPLGPSYAAETKVSPHGSAGVTASGPSHAAGDGRAPLHGLPGGAEGTGVTSSGPSHAVDAPVPLYGLPGGAANAGPSASGPSHAAGNAPVPLFGISGSSGPRGAWPAERGPSGAAGEATPFGSHAGGASAGQRGQSDAADDASTPLFGLSGAGRNGGAAGPAPTTGDAPFGPSSTGGRPSGASTAEGGAHGKPGAPSYGGLQAREAHGASQAGPTGAGSSPGIASMPPFSLSGLGEAPPAEQGLSGAALFGHPGPSREASAAPYGAGAQGPPYGGPTPSGPPRPTGPGPANGATTAYGTSGYVYGGSGQAGPGSPGAGPSGSHRAGPVEAGDAAAAFTGPPGLDVAGSANGQRVVPGQSGAHHAPATGGDMASPSYGQAATNGSGPSNPGAPAGGYHVPPGDDAARRYGRPTPAPSNGSHHAPAAGTSGETALPRRAGAAPVGRDASGDAPIPMYGLPGTIPAPSSSNPGLRPPRPGPAANPGKADINSDTTAFRAQPAPDTTPAWGEAAFGGPDATMVATPGRPGAPPSATDVPGTASEPRLPSRKSRHGSRGEGRHGRDDPQPDATRVFPTGER
jgi:hypothetical protein